MSQNDEKIVSHVDPMFTYIEHAQGYVLNVPLTDDIVVLAMRRTDYETLICTYNDKMITNSKTRKGAKEGKIPNPSINGFGFIINNNQAKRLMQNIDSVKKIYVSDQDYYTRINTPSSRSKGNISPVQAGKLTPVKAPTLLANLQPIAGAPMSNPILLPSSTPLLYMSPSETSEQD